MNVAGYALRPPRGPKDAMPHRHHQNSGFGTVIDAKKEHKP
jgi:hypothetical protein